MLASKTPYAVPLGGPAAQTPVTIYNTTTSQRPTMNTKPQESVGFSSPTKSEVSDGQDELASVRCDPDIFEEQRCHADDRADRSFYTGLGMRNG